MAVSCGLAARSRAIHSLHTSARSGSDNNEMYVLIGHREHFGDVCHTSLAAVFFLTSCCIETFSISASQETLADGLLTADMNTSLNVRDIFPAAVAARKQAT